MKNTEIKELLSNMVMKCDEEEILNIIKIFSNLIKCEDKNTRIEFINNISQIYLGYSDEPMPKDNKDYNDAVIEQNKLLRQYIPEDNQIDFDYKYCLPLIFEYTKAYEHI